MKTVVLENVKEEHLAVLKALSKTLHFKLKAFDTVSNPLVNRIESIEQNEAKLITPNWEEILQKADSL